MLLFTALAELKKEMANPEIDVKDNIKHLNKRSIGWFKVSINDYYSSVIQIY